MNPITNAKNLNKLNDRELSLGLTGSKTSWHSLYKESAWIFVGGLAYDLTEGDVIAVFSQYGEIVNINLVRDKKTGKPKGYCFICYEDQQSTILAVDNFNGIKLLNRILRVDHVQDYKIPKEFGDEDDVTRQIRSEGCGPSVKLVSEVKTEKLPSTENAGKKRKVTKVKEEQLSDSEDDRSQQDERPKQKYHKNIELHNESSCATVKVKEELADSQYEKYDKRDDYRSKDKSRNEKKVDSVDDEDERNSRRKHRPKDKKDEHKEQKLKYEKSYGKRHTSQSSSSSDDYSTRLAEKTSVRDGRDRSFQGIEEPDVRHCPNEENRERFKKRPNEATRVHSVDLNRNKRDLDKEKYSRNEESSSGCSERKGQKRESEMKGHQSEKRYDEESRRNAGRQEVIGAKRSSEQYDSYSENSREFTRRDRSKDKHSDNCKHRSRSSSSDEYDRKKRRRN